MSFSSFNQFRWVLLFINIHIFDYLDPPESFVVKVLCKIACKFSVKIKLQVFNALLEIIMFKLLSSCLIKCFLKLISQGISHYVKNCLLILACKIC